MVNIYVLFWQLLLHNRSPQNLAAQYNRFIRCIDAVHQEFEKGVAMRACLLHATGVSAGRPSWLGDLPAGAGGLWRHLQSSVCSGCCSERLTVYMWLLCVAGAPSLHGSLKALGLFIRFELLAWRCKVLGIVFQWTR